MYIGVPFDGDDSMQFLVEGLDDDAKRAAAKDLLDFIVGQATEPARSSRRLQISLHFGFPGERGGFRIIVLVVGTVADERHFCG